MSDAGGEVIVAEQGISGAAGMMAQGVCCIAESALTDDMRARSGGLAAEFLCSCALDSELDSVHGVKHRKAGFLQREQ